MNINRRIIHYGFRPGSIRSLCGMSHYLSHDIARVTCKRCLRLRAAQASGKTPGPARPNQIVYCIRQADAGPIKIGITDNLSARVRAIQTSNPYPLTVLWTRQGGSQLERKLHRELSDLRLSGEWFRPEALARLEAMAL